MKGLVEGECHRKMKENANELGMEKELVEFKEIEYYDGTTMSKIKRIKEKPKSFLDAKKGD